MAILLSEYLVAKSAELSRNGKMLTCHSSKEKTRRFNKKGMQVEGEKRKNLVEALMRGHSAKSKTN